MRSFIICTHPDQVKSNEVGRTCSMHGRGQNSVQGFGGKPEGKRALGRPIHRGRMGSEWILGKLAVRCGLDWTGS
jgi:hypothetical protein